MPKAADIALYAPGEVNGIYKSFDRTENGRGHISGNRRYERQRRNKRAAHTRRNGSIVSAFGTTLLILLALFFAFTAWVWIYSRDMSGEQVIETVESGGEAQSISFPEERYYLAGNMSTELRLVTVPAVLTSEVLWNSSDPSVARVDQWGKVTAVGTGRAVIYAVSNGKTARAEITVSDDLTGTAAAAVGRVAAEAEAYDGLKAFDGLFGEDMPIYTVLRAVTEDTEDIDENVIIKAAAECGIDRETILTAALTGRLIRSSENAAAALSFTGDVTLGRFNENGGSGRFPQVYADSGSYTYPFDKVKPLFGCDDLTTVNFEGTLTNSVIHKAKTYYFRGDPAYAGILTSSGIECAGLENNHSGDYYAIGIKETKKFLATAGVSVFDADEPLTITLSASSGAVNIVMIGFMWASGDAPPASSLEALYSQIIRYQGANNVVVVNCHWGREGARVPAEWQQAAAHKMIDSGADIIIGHHPHVVQGIEKYNGRYIAYSLGNFAFGGNSRVSNPESMILRAKVSADESGMTVGEIEVIPCLSTSSGSEVNNYQPAICFGEQRESVINTINERSAQLEYGIRIE